MAGEASLSERREGEKERKRKVGSTVERESV
jgi:hypothetical protein